VRKAQEAQKSAGARKAPALFAAAHSLRGYRAHQVGYPWLRDPSAPSEPGPVPPATGASAPVSARFSLLNGREKMTWALTPRGSACLQTVSSCAHPTGCLARIPLRDNHSRNRIRVAGCNRRDNCSRSHSLDRPLPAEAQSRPFRGMPQADTAYCPAPQKAIDWRCLIRPALYPGRTCPLSSQAHKAHQAGRPARPAAPCPPAPPLRMGQYRPLNRSRVRVLHSAKAAVARAPPGPAAEISDFHPESWSPVLRLR